MVERPMTPEMWELIAVLRYAVSGRVPSKDFSKVDLTRLRALLYRGLVDVDPLNVWSLTDQGKALHQ